MLGTVRRLSSFSTCCAFTKVAAFQQMVATQATGSRALWRDVWTTAFDFLSLVIGKEYCAGRGDDETNYSMHLGCFLLFSGTGRFLLQAHPDRHFLSLSPYTHVGLSCRIVRAVSIRSGGSGCLSRLDLDHNIPRQHHRHLHTAGRDFLAA